MDYESQFLQSPILNDDSVNFFSNHLINFKLTGFKYFKKAQFFSNFT